MAIFCRSPRTLCRRKFLPAMWRFRIWSTKSRARTRSWPRHWTERMTVLPSFASTPRHTRWGRTFERDA
jgi:hypothetical protein